jgi:hypothetical protein
MVRRVDKKGGTIIAWRSAAQDSPRFYANFLLCLPDRNRFMRRFRSAAVRDPYLPVEK